MSEPIWVGDTEVAAGEQCSLELLCARLPTHTQLSIPVVVVNGRRPGPVLWLSAALHGDELNGVEIIREILAAIRPDNLRGAIIAVPIVNVFGYLHQSRYLPDGRDLNRSFPGSARGSLASRVAHLFMSEIVGKATHGIDLHTATHHRTNLPQVRADLDDEGSRACAIAFGAPATIHARVRDGSLREAATRRGIPVVVYEGGEALRFDQEVIRVGVRGVGQVMQSLGMTKDRGKKRQHSALTATHTT